MTAMKVTATSPQRDQSRRRPPEIGGGSGPALTADGDVVERAWSGARWMLGSRLVSQVVAWGITVRVAQLLDPTDYGLCEIATMFAG